MKKICFIAGHHRSGTSALSGALSALGGDVGTSTGQTSKWNKKGYWENKKINEFNTKFLRSRGHEWYSTDYSITNMPWVSSIKPLGELLESELSSCKGNFLILKSPMISTLYPLYKEALRLKSLDGVFIFSYREKEKNIKSIVKRNKPAGITDKAAGKVIDFYRDSFEYNFDNSHRTIYHNMDNLFVEDNPLVYFKQVEKLLSLGMDFSAESIVKLNGFLSESMIIEKSSKRKCVVLSYERFAENYEACIDKCYPEWNMEYAIDVIFPIAGSQEEYENAMRLNLVPIKSGVVRVLNQVDSLSEKLAAVYDEVMVEKI